MAKRAAKSILADNLRRLMAHYADLNTIMKLSKRSKVPSGTVGRIRNAETNCRIDNLQAIAAAFDLEAWHLLTPELDPSNPPVVLSGKEKSLYDSLRRTFAEATQK